MSFKSRDLMIDVLPAAKPADALAQPGFALCGQITAGGGDDDKGLDCGQATASDESSFTGGGLALLRGQLHQALAAEARV